MNRRTFLSTVTAGLLGAPLAAEAAIAVGDVPGHQVRIFEIRAKYTNDAPVYAGVKVVEGWTRALSDYTNGSGRSSGYGISTLENGDKIFSSFETLLHTFYWKTHFMAEISDDAVEATVSHFATVPSPRSVIVFQQYRGAVSRVGHAATSFSHREAQYDFIPTSIWTDFTESENQMNWVRQLWETMKPFSTGGEYVNNLGEEGEDRVRAAYGGNHERLVVLKNRYDPTNVFRLNANIKPTV